MLRLFLFVFRFVRLLFSGHEAIALENAALLMQIAAFQRKRKCPLLTAWDRVFWITLRSLWSEWRHPLIYVQADTVVRWHRERFRKFWARLSKPQHRRPGRPGTAAELRRLIERMAAANPLWRAPRCTLPPSAAKAFWISTTITLVLESSSSDRLPDMCRISDHAGPPHERLRMTRGRNDSPFLFRIEVSSTI